MGKYLVTGGSGFIGTHVVEHLLRQNEEVLNLDVHTPKKAEHMPYWKSCELCDFQTLRNLILDFAPEYVIHLAARTDLRGKTIEEYQANTVGVLYLLDILDQLDSLKRVIFASSMYVCRPGYTPLNFEDYQPHTVYGESKVLTEQYIKERNPSYPWAIIRPTSIWGPYFGEPYLLFFTIVLSKKYFHFGSRACKKTYGYIENVIHQLSCLLDSPSDLFEKKVFYLGDYEPYDIAEWADEIAAINTSKIITIPFFLFKLAGWFGDFLAYFGIKFPMTSFRLSNMTTDNIFDLSLIKEIAPTLPTTRIEGTRKTVDWINHTLSK